jgi:hypothetical protein
MMDYAEIFKENKILRCDGSINKGPLDRYILSKNIDLKNLIYSATSFLDSAVNTSYDRVYSLLYNFPNPKYCNQCNKQIRLSSKHSFCSITCFNKNDSVAKRRSETLSKIDPLTGISKAKAIGLKGSKTKTFIDENGSSISKRTGAKLSKVLLDTNNASGISLAKARGAKISNTVNKINELTGKSIAGIRGENLSKLLNTVNHDGILESSRRSQMALETMKNKMDLTTGLNHSQLRSYKAALSKESTGKAMSQFGGRKDEFKKYKSYVISYTFQNNLSDLDNFDKRGNHAKDKSAYHIDHKFSALEGFKHNIDPKIIGNICNLQMIPWLDNIQKGSTCSITKDQLLLNYKQISINMQ